MGYTIFVNCLYSNLISIFNILNVIIVISICGQQKHLIFEIEPCDFLKMFSRSWQFEILTRGALGATTPIFWV